MKLDYSPKRYEEMSFFERELCFLVYVYEGLKQQMPIVAGEYWARAQRLRTMVGLEKSLPRLQTADPVPHTTDIA